MLNKIKKKYFIDKLTQKIDVRRYLSVTVRLVLLILFNSISETQKKLNFC